MLRQRALSSKPPLLTADPAEVSRHVLLRHVLQWKGQKGALDADVS